jgi:Rad3-related DNA helicase
VKHQVITVAELLASFPHDRYKEVLPNQLEGFAAIAQHDGTLTLEAPTGSGKTAIGYTFLKALRERGKTGGLLYIAPSKTLVQQVQKLHPDVKVAYGRNEHPCLYYKDADGVPKPKKADEVPCSFLVRHPTHPCPHYVDQKTGETLARGADPCPYFLQKYEARQPGAIAVVTGAFALLAQVFQGQFGELAGTVIDEAHKIARSIRSVLSYDITDYHLELCVKLCQDIGAEEEAAGLDEFRKALIRIVDRRKKNRRLKNRPLLAQAEIQELLDVLQCINEKKLEQSVKQAIREGRLDVEEQLETLKHMETVLRDLRRYITSLGYAMPTERRGALNYLYAYYQEEKPDGADKKKKVRYRLVVKAYKVTALVKKMLGSRSLAMSATIGNRVFAMETGIESPIVQLKSDFVAANTRVYLPCDTANLAKNERGQGQPGKTMRRVAEACGTFAQHGHRSLVLVVSNEERQMFHGIATEYGLDIRTYGDGVTAREMAVRFRNGDGTVLVGTLAQYGEGYDLPDGIAPVVHILRPGYPHPFNPETQFEEERFGNGRWALWQWRVMIEALQGRGRNVRSKNDRGVTIFYSQQFRSFLFASLPEYLYPSYHGDWRLERCIEDAIALFDQNDD